MSNLKIVFSYPWLLLILVLLFASTLIPYFLLSKKYRRTRNRIVSMVLHLLIGVMAICLLAGMKFTYTIPNEENEIILVVDISQTMSNEESFEETRDEYVKSLINYGKEDGYKMGIVTYGYTPEYAVELTHNLNGVYDDYIEYFNTCKIDRTATDLASALTFARDLISHPKTAKLIIVSDGKETDRNANEVIRSITGKGIKIDAVYVDTDITGDDAQVVGIEYEDTFITPGVESTLNITIQSNSNQAVVIEVYDNDKVNSDESLDVNLYKGTQTIIFHHTFTDEVNLHEIRIEMTAKDDVEENNTYYSYYNFANYTKVLVLESFEGQSDNLEELLSGAEFEVTVKNLYLSEGIPDTVEKLLAYDQIILNNVANKDISSESNGNIVDGFDEILYSYVNDYGGGMLTLGGKNAEGEANAYNWTDMPGTLYQEMLPVQAINYTPPVAVIVIIDISGSMTSAAAGDASGKTKLEWARNGAESCYNALTERDYFGLMTLSSYQGTVLDLTPCTNRNKIVGAIYGKLGDSGGTSYSGAIEAAGQKLAAMDNVAKRHIIVVSDGAVPDSDREKYESNITNNYKASGITFSVVAIGLSSTDEEKMQTAVDKGHGRLYNLEDPSELTNTMREDVSVDEIKSVNTDPFVPTIYNASTYVTEGVKTAEGSVSKLTFELGGFYGTKVKDYEYLILTGDYNVPLYAQRTLGLGSVGSLMIDLYSADSEEMLKDPNGVRLVVNIVKNLMPKSNIRPNPLSVTLREDNYTNSLIVYGNLEEGEKVEAEITNTLTDVSVSLNEAYTEDSLESFCIVTSPLSAENFYSRCNFILKESGAYTITVRKLDAQGNLISEVEVFKAFSYSEEYDLYVEEGIYEGIETLTRVTELSNGFLVIDDSDLFLVFDDFITDIPMEYDPRYLFMILAIIFFLLDITVRKFKFKWLHEIINDIKNKKSK